RERRSDIKLLIEYFMKKISRKLNKEKVVISDEAIEKLSSYDWPGNIRELENYIELVINTEELPDIYNMEINNYNSNDIIKTSTATVNLCSLKDLEKQHIINVMKTNSNNITQAAIILGIGRNTLYRKIKEYEIFVP
ncbi:helix-turn-helix domain-containing protein, partial [Sedimentibacter sp.]